MKELLLAVTSIDQMVGGARFLGYPVKEKPVQNAADVSGILRWLASPDSVKIWIASGIGYHLEGVDELRGKSRRIGDRVAEKIPRSDIQAIADAVKDILPDVIERV